MKHIPVNTSSPCPAPIVLDTAAQEMFGRLLWSQLADIASDWHIINPDVRRMCTEDAVELLDAFCTQYHIPLTVIR